MKHTLTLSLLIFPWVGFPLAQEKALPGLFTPPEDVAQNCLRQWRFNRLMFADLRSLRFLR